MPYVQHIHREGECPVCHNFHQLEDGDILPIHWSRHAAHLQPCSGSGQHVIGKVREHQAIYYQSENGKEKRI